MFFPPWTWPYPKEIVSWWSLAPGPCAVDFSGDCRWITNHGGSNVFAFLPGKAGQSCHRCLDGQSLERNHWCGSTCNCSWRSYLNVFRLMFVQNCCVMCKCSIMQLFIHFRATNICREWGAIRTCTWHTHTHGYIWIYVLYTYILGWLFTNIIYIYTYMIIYICMYIF